MLAAFFLAFGQLFSPGFRSILLKSVGLTLGLFILIGFGAKKLLDAFTFVSYGWLESTIDIVAALGLIAGMVFLIAPVTALVAGLFLDRIAEQVEARHYPNDLPGVDPPVGRSLFVALKFTFVIVLVNLFVLIIALLPGINIAVFLAGNGYLLGREYFEMVGMRFLTPKEVKALRKRNAGKVFTAGLFIALLAAIPFVNLLVPLFATAFMVHVYKQVAAGGSEDRRPRVSLR